MTNAKTLYPLVVVDVALFSVDDTGLKVLLVKRSNEPAQGLWALPGGLLQPDVDRNLESAARRVLQEKIGVEVPYLSEIRSFSGADRDPRGWSIGMLFFALLPKDQINAVIKASVDQVEWVDASRLDRAMAFDHSEQIAAAATLLRGKVERNALPLHLMPKEFTLSALQCTCEAILGRPLDKSVFRRRLKDSSDLIPLHLEVADSPRRPARLYSANVVFTF